MTPLHGAMRLCNKSNNQKLILQFDMQLTGEINKYHYKIHATAQSSVENRKHWIIN